MQTVIEVEKRTHYGSEYLYAANNQAEKACKLINGQKTLTPANIAGLKEMGFIVKQVVIAGGKSVEVGEL